VPSSNYQFDRYELDLKRYELRRDKHVLKLEKIPMELLILLVSRRGELVSREEIIEEIWGRDVFLETEHSINTAVGKIRKTLRDDPVQPRFVQTVVGKGYRFVAAVSNGAEPLRSESADQATGAADEADQRPRAGSNGDAPGAALTGLNGHQATQPGRASVELEKEPLSERGGRRKPGYFRTLWAAGAVTAVALLSLAIVHFLRPSLFSPLLSRRVTIAVLPFVNLSGDPAEEYLSDGMTEEVISALGQVDAERLGVIARTSAMHYKHTDNDVRQIGHELGADYILEGSVRRAGDRIRVTAQLIEAGKQTDVWSQDYEALDFNEIPRVQTQIRNAITNVLRLKTESQHGPTPNVQTDAYQFYLKGRYFLDRRDPASLQKALGYFQQSTARDGSFARAWASVALSYELLEYVRAISPREAYPEARAAVTRALQLDSELAEAHTAQAYIHEHYEWNWKEADREMERALMLDPNYELARQWFSYGLVRRGETQRAVEEMRHALALDPVSFRVNVTMAERLERAGHHSEAIQQYLTALELSPDDAGGHARLGSLYAKGGDFGRAAEEYRRGIQLSGDQELEKRFTDLNARGGFLAAHAVIESEKFRAVLRKLDSRAARGEYVSPSDYAFAYAALGERKQTMEWLERAYEERASVMLELGDPIFDKVRDAPEFEELVRRLKTSTIAQS